MGEEYPAPSVWDVQSIAPVRLVKGNDGFSVFSARFDEERIAFDDGR